MPHAVVGSQLYTATEICERALHMIGSFTVNMEAAEEEDVQESLFWLDMLMANEAGSGRRFWLVRDELEIDLAATIADYVLAEELPDLKEGVQFPIEAMIEDANGQRVPVTIVQQRKFRRIEKPDTTGTPCQIFIDRLNGPTLHVYPVPTATDVGSKIILTVQTFADSVKPKGLTGNSGLGNETAGFRPAWNLWAVHALAALIGNGPVRALPLQRVTYYENKAAALHLTLEAFENREHDNEEPYVTPSIYS